MNSITGIIITLNEEQNISDCIRNMKQVCNEIIVVDSCSTDHTLTIAEELGAVTVVQPYLGDGFQKNVGIPRAGNEWILSLDADERLTDEMVKVINELDLDNSEYDAYAFPRRNYIGSRWIKHGGWYPDVCIRLFDRRKTKFKEVKQHSYVETANYKRLKADIIHYSFRNIGELFAKPGRNFSTRGAKIMYEKGKKANACSPVIHGTTAFLRHYILRYGFLDGIDGITVSLSSGINSYLKYAKLLEYQRDPKVLANEDFKKIW
jgi:glycosyltransferase involved in cell wall biosynthesis